MTDKVDIDGKKEKYVMNVYLLDSAIRQIHCNSNLKCRPLFRSMYDTYSCKVIAVLLNME